MTVCPAWFCVMKEEYEREKVEINDLNNLIENLLKLEEEDIIEIGDDMDEYAMEVCDGDDENVYNNMVAETNAEDEGMGEKKPKDDDRSMKLGDDSKPDIVDTDEEKSMELCDEPETNVVDNTVTVRS